HLYNGDNVISRQETIGFSFTDENGNRVIVEQGKVEFSTSSGQTAPAEIGLITAAGLDQNGREVAIAVNFENVAISAGVPLPSTDSVADDATLPWDVLTPRQVDVTPDLTPNAISRTAGTETQSFDTAQGAALAGWTGTDNRSTTLGADFGYSATNNSGGAASGEAGGTFSRTLNSSLYTDRTLGGILSTQDALSFSTNITVRPDGGASPDHVALMGWFSEDGTQYLGVGIAEPQGGGYRLRISYNDGSGRVEDTTIIQLASDTDYTLTFDYDPVTESVTVNATGATLGGTATFSVAGLDIDVTQFGLATADHTGPQVGNTFDIFVDDVTYTTVGGSDSLSGGDGNDLVVGGLGDDVVLGDAGNDQLFGDLNDGASNDYEQAVLDRNPVAFWRLDDDGSQDRVKDATGQVRDGTLNGGVMTGVQSYDGTSTAMRFDGTDDYVEIPNDPAFDLTQGAISMWFKLDNLAAVSALISRSATGLSDAFDVSITPAGLISIDHGVDDITRTEASTVTAGEWYNLIYTWGPEGSTLYLDGEMVDQNAQAVSLVDNDQPIIIGADSDTSTAGTTDTLESYFNGDIADIALFDTQVRPEDASELYRRGASGGADQIVGGAGDDVIDGGAGDDVIAGDSRGVTFDTSLETSGVVVENSGNSSLDLQATDFTIEARVTWDSNDTSGYILAKETSYYLSVFATGEVRLWTFPDGNAWNVTGITLTEGVSSDIAVIFDDLTKTFSFVQDGVTTSQSLTVGSLADATGDLMIGNRESTSFDDPFDGVIEYVRVWDTEVATADLHTPTGDAHPDAANLLLDADFRTASDIATADASGNFTLGEVGGVRFDDADPQNAGGDDTISGGRGDDVISGGAGNDTISGDDPDVDIYDVWAAELLASDSTLSYNAETNKFYRVVADNQSWADARADALATILGDDTGALVNIGSQEEQDFVAALTTFSYWIGATDEVTEGDWRWVDGSLDGTSFWSGNASGSALGFANWNTGEPNDSGGNEDYANGNASDVWVDIPGTFFVGNYIIEWEAEDVFRTRSGADDVIDGGTGDDTINAGDGRDAIIGGAGRDVIDAGSGDDTIFGDDVEAVIADGDFSWITPPAGSFTIVSDAFGGWTVTADTVDVQAPDFGGGVDSFNKVDLNGSGSSAGAISQTIATVPGQTYTITFLMSGNWQSGDAVKDVDVIVGDESTSFSMSQPPGWSWANMQWETNTVTFTATKAETDITFASRDTPSPYGPVIAQIQIDTFTDTKPVGDVIYQAWIDGVLATHDGLVYNEETGKFYLHVTDNAATWTEARQAALDTKIGETNGALVNIADADENTFVANLSPSSDFWIGATDETVEGEWRWVDGSLDGTQFWSGDETGGALTYAGFDGVLNPSDSGSNEDYAEIRNTDSLGVWNDLSDSNPNPSGYVVEWTAADVYATWVDRGNDVINAGDGDDTIFAGGGNDEVDGGDGTDTLVLSGNAADYTVRYSGALAGSGYVITDNRFGSPDGSIEVVGIENLQFVDQLTTPEALIPSEIDLGTGNNVYTASASDGEAIFANNGNDTVTGSAGNDRVRGWGGNDIIDGGAGDDILWGQSGVDTIRGGAGDDWIRGGFNDGAADALLDGGEGSDAIFLSGDAVLDNVNDSGAGGYDTLILS
ncbi:MAG: LamG-like jellyroll fold domain-containing protein, partial [Pseudomonadota bacterium]